MRWSALLVAAGLIPVWAIAVVAPSSAVALTPPDRSAWEASQRALTVQGDAELPDGQGDQREPAPLEQPDDEPPDPLEPDPPPDVPEREPEDEAPTDEPLEDPDEELVEPDDDPPADQFQRPATVPAVQDSTIPRGSILLAIAVLVVGAMLLRVAVRRDRAATSPPTPAEPGPAATPVGFEPVTHPGSASAISDAQPPAAVAPAASADPSELDLDAESLAFLLALGEALIDAGDAVNHVQETLQNVAAINGVRDVGVVALPTALIVSLPRHRNVQTEVSPAGRDPLRLDQIDEVFRIVGAAERGELGPGEGLDALERARTLAPPYTVPVRLAGYVLFSVGLALILRGGPLDLLLAGGLGLVVAALKLAGERLESSYHAFVPLVAAFGVSTVVFAVGRVLPDVSVFPPLVAPLVMFLPGALLTTAVFEVSTNHIISGAGRLASGALQLVLLALGILAGAQLVGVPAATIGALEGDAVSVLAPWVGVAVFGLGVLLFRGARRASWPWILAVLYVAYAGQVLGGLFFGSALSAFFGALAMTPVAMIAARQPSGPPTLVSFLPGFWLLVPGALGLAGVTKFLDEDRIEGVSSLVAMGTAMVGIALGVLLGLAIGAQVTVRFRRLLLPHPSPDPRRRSG